MSNGVSATAAEPDGRTPGKSTNTTVRSPLDHTGPPQASQDGRGLRERITTSVTPREVMRVPHNRILGSRPPGWEDPCGSGRYAYVRSVGRSGRG